MRGLLAAVLALLMVAAAMAQAPADAVARQLDKDLRGCWVIYEADKSGTDYRSLCFVDDGQVETVEISGATGSGLSGTSDGGSYAIGGTQVSFPSGAYGWMWQLAGMTCKATLADQTHLDLTACGEGIDDLHLEREAKQ